MKPWQQDYLSTYRGTCDKRKAIAKADRPLSEILRYITPGTEQYDPDFALAVADAEYMVALEMVAINLEVANDKKSRQRRSAAAFVCNISMREADRIRGNVAAFQDALDRARLAEEKRLEAEAAAAADQEEPEPEPAPEPEPTATIDDLKKSGGNVAAFVR